MIVHEIIKDIDKAIPHNIKQAKSKVILPTYKFVTSTTFVVCIYVVAILLAAIWLQTAFAYSQDEIDRNGIKDIQVNQLNDYISSVTFSYCHNKYNRDSIGALITSDLDAVPVPISSSDVKYRYCATYGAKILSEADSTKITLFEQKDIDGLISSFNAKIHDLNNNLTQINQKINGYKKLNDDEKIVALTQKANLVEQQIESAQTGLKTLIAIKAS